MFAWNKKSFAISIIGIFFSSYFLSVFQKQIGKSLFTDVLLFVNQEAHDQDRAYFIRRTDKCFC